MDTWQHWLEGIIRRIRGEYLEMPGLALTLQQAQRLWGLDAWSCRTVLNALVDTGFLARTPQGAFVHHDRSSPVLRTRASGS